jgi:hypothetical protein
MGKESENLQLVAKRAMIAHVEGLDISVAEKAALVTGVSIAIAAAAIHASAKTGDKAMRELAMGLINDAIGPEVDNLIEAISRG